MDGEREGQDITAPYMIVPEEDSDIKKFFSNAHVLLTGATGSLGKLALEKILRVFPDIGKVFVLIRSKNGIKAETRLRNIFEEPCFERLYRTQPEFQEKISVINGDISLPGLGLSTEDQQTLVAEVDCILHFAAAVKFDKHLKAATYANVRAVKDLIHLAKQMKKLKGFLHVSTVFSNCNQKEIDEKFYKPPITADKLITLVECLDDEQLKDITKTVIKPFPNTYNFTKCVAEDLIRTEGQSLPVALFRPSIVIATVKEPVSGWVDSIYGVTGALVCASIGVLRSLYCNKNNVAELVPADYVINAGLAAMWDVATMRSLNDNKELQSGENREDKYHNEVPIYNFVSSPENPIIWDDVKSLGMKHTKQVPSQKMVWYFIFKMRSSYVEHKLAVIFLHTIPAYIIDFVLGYLKKKPVAVATYKKLNRFLNTLEYFTIREWKFKNENVRSLWARMKRNDKELFEFDVSKINWDLFFYTYVRGARVYLLKDPLTTIPQGTRKLYKLMIIHYLTLLVVWILIFTILWVIIKLLV